MDAAPADTMPGHTVDSLLSPTPSLTDRSSAYLHPAYSAHPPDAHYPSLIIRNVHLPKSDDSTLVDPLYNVYCVGSRIERVELATRNGSRSVSGLNSGRNSPALLPYCSSGSPRSKAHPPHSKLDAGGRSILLLVYVPRLLSVPSLRGTHNHPVTASATRTST